MRIEQWTEAERLIPLLEYWRSEQNGDVMGIDMDMDTFVSDQNKWMQSLGGTILVAIDKDELVGFMTLLKVPSEFGKQSWGIEKGWYVKPKIQIAGIRLYHQAEKWCKENGCSHLVMSASHLASDLHDKVCKFYCRMNMRKFQTSFIKEIA